MDWLDRPTVPVAYALLIRDVAASFGVGAELLDAAGLGVEALADSTGRISANQAGTLLHLAREMSGEPGFGLELGLHSSLTSHGVVGFGLLTSSDLREAIGFGAEYSRARLPMLQLSLVHDDDQAGVDVAALAPLGPVRACTFELFLVGLARLAPVLTGRAVRDHEMWFEGPEPAYFERYRSRLPPARFDTGVHQLRFPAALLDRPFDTANRVAAQEAQQQVAGELDRIGIAGDVVAQVRALLATPASGFDLTTVARTLHLSPRTLRRRLHEHGVAFHDLVADARRANAVRLLRHSTLTVEQVAGQLGYSDAGNFCRAFKRWTGRTPGEFRSGTATGVGQ